MMDEPNSAVVRKYFLEIFYQSFLPNSAPIPTRVKTANHDGISRVGHLVIRSLHDVLERRQIRGYNVGGSEPVLLTHFSKVADVLYNRLFNMLRLNERRELTPLAMGWGGSMVSYEKTKKLLLNWESQWGSLSEVEALFETLGAIIEGEDTTDNETGCVVKMGELAIRRILQIKNALLKLFIEPNGKVEDARSNDVRTNEEKEALAEKKGEVIRKQFEEDVVLGFGLKLENLTAEMCHYYFLREVCYLDPRWKSRNPHSKCHS